MPTPGKNETHKDFISRCIPVVIRDKTAKDGAQARAVCESIWKKTKGLDMLILRLVDFIGEDVQEFLDSLPTNGEDLTLEINSPGGDVFAGIAIYNKLNELKGTLTVDIIGLAASAASLIAMAGDEILIRDNARIMIHNPFTGKMGDAKALEKTAEQLKEIENQIAGIYAARTGIDRRTVLKMMDDETWLKADEAVKKGFATRVVKEAKQDAKNYTGAVLMQLGFKNIPKEFNLPKINLDEETIMIKEIAELLECKAEEVLDKIKELIQAAAKKVEPTGDEGEIDQAVQKELNAKDAKIANLESAVATMTPQLQSFSAYRLEQDKNGRKEQLQILLKGDGEHNPKITPAQLPGAEALLDLDDGFVAFDAFYAVMQAGPDLDLATVKGNDGDVKDKNPVQLATDLANAKIADKSAPDFTTALKMVFKEKPELEEAYNKREE
jgi:ATP-dependent Clp endopeptidase proteolytic subunit ClpP